MMHPIHFIYIRSIPFWWIHWAICLSSQCSTTGVSHCGLEPVPRRKEGNILFNDALNTFYLRLYGIGHLVKDHSDSERGNPLPPHGLLFPVSSISHRQDSTYHSLCYTSRGALASAKKWELYLYLYVILLWYRHYITWISVMTNWSFVLFKEGNVLFNDALNTFYLWLYGVKHMVKDH